MKSVADIAPRHAQSANRRLANELRRQITKGTFPPGTQLPSTEELAATWGSSYGTVHTATMTLVREGWLERRHGSGTYVVDPEKRFACAGIYHGVDICSNEHSPFVRNLHFSLLAQFKRIKKETRIFIDSRTIAEKSELMPALAEAILHRQIQCLTVSTPVNAAHLASLSKLTLPTAIAAYSPASKYIDFDRESMVREAVRRLAAQGCRSVGIISNLYLKNHSMDEPLYAAFRQAAHDEGLVTQENWIRTLSRHSSDMEHYGYTEFLEFWKLPKKPDGLIALPDVVAHGVITAILKLRISVPRQLKCIFHRNAHFRLLCPFPVDWAISDEEALAKGMVQIIEKQFRGEETPPVFLPYKFEKN